VGAGLDGERTLPKSVAGILLLFIVLGLLFTYPLPLHLADAVEDRQDALLNVWITAWDGHQLLNDPLHLFEANIFDPCPHTLAYSELLLGNGLLALPITAVSGNPVLGYNVALLLSFVLSGLGAFLLAFELSRSWGAGLVAGAIYAFSSYRLTNLAQAQLLITQWLPFALLALIHLLRQPRPRRVAALVLFFCLQALSSFYYAFLLGLTVLGYLLWALLARRSKYAMHRTAFPALLVAALLCTLILVPFAWPYFQVQRELGFERSLADSEPFSASLRQYGLVPPASVLSGLWLPSDDTPLSGGYPPDALFPGLIALALAFSCSCSLPLSCRWVPGSTWPPDIRPLWRPVCPMPGSMRSCLASKHCGRRPALTCWSPCPWPCWPAMAWRPWNGRRAVRAWARTMGLAGSAGRTGAGGRAGAASGPLVGRAAVRLDPGTADGL